MISDITVMKFIINYIVAFITCSSLFSGALYASENIENNSGVSGWKVQIIPIYFSNALEGKSEQGELNVPIDLSASELEVP